MAKKYALGIISTKGHSVSVGDIDLYYEEYGTGKPLLLLHGFGGCAQNWHPFTAKLSRHYRLIVVDLRGHGHSTNPGNRFTHREAADDIFSLLDKLGIDHFSAMGMSTGGMVLLHMATGQPHRIDSMVLISATSYFPDQARAIMRRASFGYMPAEVQDMYRECAKRGDGQIRQLITQFNALSENYDDINFTAQNLSTIAARTLIVHGDRDNFFPVEIAVDIYRAIQGAALWVIPGGGHVPIYDHVASFISLAVQFMDKPGNAYA